MRAEAAKHTHTCKAEKFGSMPQHNMPPSGSDKSWQSMALTSQGRVQNTCLTSQIQPEP